MKKLVTLLIATVMSLSLCSCNDNSKVDIQSVPEQQPEGSYIRDLEVAAQNGGTDEMAWTLYVWFTNNLDDFKDPSSVELTDDLIYYHENPDTSEIEYFLVNIRGNNSFGGKTVGYCKVEQFGIYHAEWGDRDKVLDRFDGDRVYPFFGSYMFEKAFDEYMKENY